MAGVQQAIYVFFPHCVRLRGETELSSILQDYEMKAVVRRNLYIYCFKSNDFCGIFKRVVIGYTHRMLFGGRDKKIPKPNSCQDMMIWVSDDQRLLAAKSGNQIQIACVDGIRLERLVSRLRKTKPPLQNTPSC